MKLWLIFLLQFDGFHFKKRNLKSPKDNNFPNIFCGKSVVSVKQK